MSILLREQEQAIAMKTETTYGTDIEPAGADAMMVHDITVRSLEGDVAKLNDLVGFLGNQGSVRINTYCSVSFKVYMRGSGVVDEAPLHNPLYEASSHAGAVTASTSVDFTLVDSDVESASIYYLAKEHKHAILGVRGKLMWNFSTTSLPYLQFDGIGLYVEPEKAVGGLPGVDFSSALKPLKWNKQTVPTLTLHGVTLDAASVEIDQGQPAEYLSLIETEEAVMGLRNATLTATIREDDIANKNWFAAAEANEEGAFAMQHGIDTTHDGRIFEFNAPAAQLTNCERSFPNGQAHLTLSVDLKATAAGNDYTFAHR